MIAVGLNVAKSRLLTQVSEGTLEKCVCEGAASCWKNGDTCCDHYIHKTAHIKSLTRTAVDQSLGLSLEYSLLTLVIDFMYYPSFKNLEYWSSFHTPDRLVT
ncbi:hypothetical protein F7725_013507, partial [Dissostichus mawsoni]